MEHSNEKTTVYILKAPKGREAKYCTVTEDGRLIYSYARLSDIRRFYQHSINLGLVELVRKLDTVYTPKHTF